MFKCSVVERDLWQIYKLQFGPCQGNMDVLTKACLTITNVSFKSILYKVCKNTFFFQNVFVICTSLCYEQTECFNKLTRIDTYYTECGWIWKKIKCISSPKVFDVCAQCTLQPQLDDSSEKITMSKSNMLRIRPTNPTKQTQLPRLSCYVDEDCVYPMFGCIIGLGDVTHSRPPTELKRDQQQGYLFLPCQLNQ